MAQIVGLAFTAFQRDTEPNSVPHLNLGAIEKQSALARSAGVDTLILGGTTDEFPSLSLDERVAIARAWRQAHPPGSTPKLVLHIGSDCIPDAQALGRLAVELQFDAALVSIPSKFRAPTLEVTPARSNSQSPDPAHSLPTYLAAGAPRLLLRDCRRVRRAASVLLPLSRRAARRL